MPAEPPQRSRVFLSPHFDDAVFSCGGTIAKLARYGYPVTVVTAMGAARVAKLAESPILKDLHQRWQAGNDPLRTRRQEDIQALRSLGAAFQHLPLADCAYRQVEGEPLYPTEESLFGRIHPQDYAADFLNQTKFLQLNRPLVAFVPLGVGHHVDHQIVHKWGLRLAREEQSNLRLRFYAEFPYSKAREAIADAMRRADMKLHEFRVEIGEAELRAKVNAIACYKSQISTFWHDLEEMEADLRRAMSDSGTGGFVERFWEFDRSTPLPGE